MSPPSTTGFFVSATRYVSRSSREQTNAARIGLLTASLLYGGFPRMYKYFYPEFATELFLDSRVVLAVVGSLFVIASFYSKQVEEKITLVFEVACFVVAFHHLAEYFSVGVYSVELSSGTLAVIACCTFGIYRRWALYVYAVSMFVGLMVLCLYIEAESYQKVDLLSHSFAILACGAFLLGSRVQADLVDAGRMVQTIDGMKEQFLQVSHDVKSPLVLLAAQLKTLSKEVDASAVQAKVARLSDLHSFQTEAVVGMLQDLRILSEKEAPRKSIPVDLKQLWLSQCTRLHEGRRVLGLTDFSFEFVGEELSAFVNPLDLSRVFENLIKNAAHAMTSAGEIQLKVKLLQEGKSSQRILCEVQNTASQIEPEVLAEIRSGVAVTTGKYGSGTGIRIIRVLVERYGGKLGFDSSEQGVIVSFDLPLYS